MRCHTLMLLLFCVLPLPTTALAQAPEPIVYTLAMPAPAEHTAVVTASVPTGGRPAIELFMARWSPGFYRIENYSQQVVEFTARSKGGEELGVEHPSDNHWRIATSGAAQVVATYTLRCQRASVTGNQVETGFAVFCGPATFVDLEGGAANPREVQLLLPADWPHSATGLAKAKDGKPHHYTAPDYDWLADSPIVAGTIRTDRFDVLGSHHEIASFGNVGAWDGALAAQKLQPIATELCRLFGTVPFEHYVFLNGLRAANGGLEHLNSTLISTDPRQHPDDLQWLAFVAHEYCHTFNVKRLRPVELGPFDYEKPPTTASLWIAEGLTTYFADLALARAGIATAPQWLALMSAHIRQLQSTAGRKQQTLADASLSVFTGSMSGVGGDPRKSVSYYVKGPAFGFVLDGRIRTATDGSKGLDDVMRLAYQRWSGAHGFTPAEFEAAAAEVAGTDLAALFQTGLRSTDELDYTEALAWFGLRFAAADEDAPREQRWALEVLPAATPAQQDHLRTFLAPSKGK